jgi:predicted nucleotidyltransferase
MVRKKISRKSRPKKEVSKTLELNDDREIAFDFAKKLYAKLGKVIKSIVLFGSAAKRVSHEKSDVDVVIIIDDATVLWDQELIAWYREEVGKIISANPYLKPLHINTVRLTTWWSEMIRGEPVIINIIRWGEPLIDFGGFFAPLKALLAQGKLKSTPEMIFITLGRAPSHMLKAKSALFSAVEGLYWAFVDSSHAALIAAKHSPPSPEHIADAMDDILVKQKMINPRYVEWYRGIYSLMHGILHQKIMDVKGSDIDMWRARADEYLRTMAIAVKRLTGTEF